MKITEATTFAELASYLKELGNPFITMMTAAPGAEHARFAVAHLTTVGSFHGAGATEAEALSDALGALHMALQARAGRDPAFNKFRAHSDQVCYGCGRTRDEHTNDSRCSQWHDAPVEPPVPKANLRTCVVCGATFATYLPEVPAEHRNNAVFSSLQLCGACNRNRSVR